MKTPYLSSCIPHSGKLEAGGWKLEAGSWRLEAGNFNCLVPLIPVQAVLKKLSTLHC
jgi:hypothetical protein